MHRFKILSWFLAIAGCLSFSSAWAAGGKIPVFVSIAPQADFVQQIGGDRVDVHILVAPGADPHTYEPKPRQMAALSKARLYFAVGIEFEKAWLGKFTAMNPALKVVHTDHGILKLPMAAHMHHHHDDGKESGTTAHDADDEHENTHDDEMGNRDPHIWLSPPLVMLQARSILTALEAVDPDHRSVYEANYRAFILSLVDLDARLRADFDGLAGAAFMVLHPSWGTFAHAYGLHQIPVEIQGKDPKPAQLKALIEHARAEGIKVVFVQPQFSAKSAEQIARAIDGRVIMVDPLARDWAANLRHAAEEFKHALR